MADGTYAQSAAPTLIAIAQPSGGVAVSWTAVAGADGYELWRYDSAWTRLDSSADPLALFDTDVTVGQTYWYSVSAVVAGRRDAWSEYVPVTPAPALAESSVTQTIALAAGAVPQQTYGDITVSGGSSLTFTPDNWNTPQTVTLRAAEDADYENGFIPIMHKVADNPDDCYHFISYHTGGERTGSAFYLATEADNDTPPTATPTITPTPTRSAPSTRLR